MVDFGEPWHGHRFWMAVTPFLGGDTNKENPSVLVSDDGQEWSVPSGLTNPIDPTPTVGYNSDTDLTYDPDNDRLILLWRASEDGLGEGSRWETLYASTSTDGVTWTAPVTLIDLQSQTTNTQLLSPSLVRVGATDWRLFITGRVRTASDPLGAWSAPTNFTGVPETGNLWHLDVNLVDGEFWMVANVRDPWGLAAATSSDGVAWTYGPNFLEASASGWDDEYPYRATMTGHENGVSMRVWYSAHGPSSYRVGYTLVPRSFWASL